MPVFMIIFFMTIAICSEIMFITIFISTLKTMILCSEEVEATLCDVKVEWEKERNGDAYKVYTPIYRYQYNHCYYKSESERKFYRNTEGEKYEKKIIRIGRKYNIFINPSNPKMCIPTRFNKDTVMDLLFNLAGAIVVPIVYFLLWRHLK